MWNMKYGTNEPIYKTADSEMQRRLVVAKEGVGRERDGLGVWGWQMQTITFRIDKQGPTVQHNLLGKTIMEKNIKKECMYVHN